MKVVDEIKTFSPLARLFLRAAAELWKRLDALHADLEEIKKLLQERP